MLECCTWPFFYVFTTAKRLFNHQNNKGKYEKWLSLRPGEKGVHHRRAALASLSAPSSSLKQMTFCSNQVRADLFTIFYFAHTLSRTPKIFFKKRPQWKKWLIIAFSLCIDCKIFFERNTRIFMPIRSISGLCCCDFAACKKEIKSIVFFLANVSWHPAAHVGWLLCVYMNDPRRLLSGRATRRYRRRFKTSFDLSFLCFFPKERLATVRREERKTPGLPLGECINKQRSGDAHVTLRRESFPSSSSGFFYCH